MATAVVRKRTLWNRDGILATLPDTIITAMASPMARPTPSTTAAAMPLFAAGTDTLKPRLHRAWPRGPATRPHTPRGTASERRDRHLDDGRAGSSPPAPRSPPAGLRRPARGTALRIPGTSTSMPDQAVHHRGDAGQQAHRPVCITAFTRFGASFGQIYRRQKADRHAQHDGPRRAVDAGQDKGQDAIRRAPPPSRPRSFRTGIWHKTDLPDGRA